MAVQPSPAPLAPSGQLSSDGLWVWNGAQWVPNPRAAASAPVRPYESAGFRALFVVLCLGINVFGIVMLLVVDLAYIATGGDITSAGDAVTIGLGLFALGTLIVYYGSLIASAVVFCMWLHRVVRNMRALGAPDPRWSPAGAVGRCFIPFLNFVHPYLSIVDAWKASDPSTLRADQSMRNVRPVAGAVMAWWLTWWAGRAVSIFSNRMINSSDTGTVVTGAVIDLVANATLIVAAGLAILVVRRLTSRQDVKQDLIATGRLV